MHNNLLNSVIASRPLNAVAAGTSVQNGTAVDMQDCDGVLFIACIGALTAGQVTSLKAQGGQASDGSDAADLASTSTGAMADGDSNRVLMLDIPKPAGFRYIRPVVVRGTQNAVIDSVVALKYTIRKSPATQSADVSKSKTVQSPAAGTP